MGTEMTLEQRRALALAQARVRAEQAAPAQADLADKYAGEDVNQLGTTMRVLGGAKGAWDRAALGLKGVFTDLTPEDKALLEQGRAFEAKAGAPATIGAIGADVAMSAAPGALVTKATAAAPLLTRALSQIGLGSGYGALTNPEDRTGGAIAGGVGTGVGMGVNRLVGGAIRPLISKDAQALMDQGIQPTIGQAIGGATNTVEQKLKSLPLAGDLIRRARGRAVDEFNEKAIQTAVPGGRGIGDEALIAARKTLSDNYKNIIPKGMNITIDDNALIKATINAADDPALGLTDAAKKRVYDYVQNNILSRSKNITGDTAKQIESDFGSFVASLKSGQSSQEERAIGKALDQVNQEWRRLLPAAADKVSPGAGQALRENDAAWRSLVALDRAGSYRGNQNVAANEVAGRFTPNSLRRSIEVSDQSQFNNATRAMRGGNTPFDRLNQLTRQGERVLGDSVPDSGTAGRLGWMNMLAGGAAGTAAIADPGTAAGAAALAFLPYSRAGSKFAMQGLTPAYEAAIRQLTLRGVPTQAIDEALRKYGPDGVISLARGIGVNTQ